MGRKGACVIPYTLESNVIELHQFLFGDELYEPTSLVRSISQKILADIGKPQETAAVTKTEAKETQTPVQEEKTETVPEQTETASEPEDSEEEDKLPIDGETEREDGEESDAEEAETEPAESKEAESSSEQAEETQTPETMLTGPTADASLTETEPLSPDREKVHTDTGLILYPGSQISSETE